MLFANRELRKPGPPVCTPVSRLAPDGDEEYVHDAEGPDDIAAHARSVAVTVMG